MKLFFLAVLLVASVFAQPQDNLDYDGLTRSTLYHTCVANDAGTLVGGTACIVYSALGKNLHWSILHSGNPLDTTSVVVTVNNAATFTFNSDTLANKSPFNVQPAAGILYGGGCLNLNPIAGAVLSQVNTAPTTTVKIVLNILNQAVTFQFTYYNSVRLVETATRPVSDRNTESQKFAPTYVETFQPLQDRVLLNRFPTNKQFQQFWTRDQFVVVAVGPQVTGLSEGDFVLVNRAACFSQQVMLNDQLSAVDNTLTFSPYCWVSSSDVYGVVSESTYGANRAAATTGHVKLANPTGFLPVERNAFAGFY